MAASRIAPKTVISAVMVVLFAATVPPAGASEPAIRIEPARTWAGLARVHLEVDDVELGERDLRGHYRVRVPLVPSKNDEGEIRLFASEPLDEVMESGGSLEGTGTSRVNDRVHEVRCTVLPGGELELKITTDRRTLRFETRYRRIPAPSSTASSDSAGPEAHTGPALSLILPATAAE